MIDEHKILDYFALEVEGGVCKDYTTIFEEMQEDGTITEEDFCDNETLVCELWDNNFFTCHQCGWSMPLEDASDNEDELVCNQCQDENVSD